MGTRRRAIDHVAKQARPTFSEFAGCGADVREGTVVPVTVKSMTASLVARHVDPTRQRPISSSHALVES